MNVAAEAPRHDQSRDASCDAPEAQTVLRGDGLRLRFERGVVALDGVDLSLSAGEHVAIVGASGGGKTTLLDCLAGERTPNHGSVTCDGRIARIYQDYRLVGRATARANVLHGAVATTRGWLQRLVNRRQLKASADAWLRRVGLEHRRSVRVDRLSGGEQQRVAIARALMTRPSVVLADEPVSALDAGSAETVMQLLRGLCRDEGIALLSVQHDLSLAETFADRVVFMRDGRLTPRPSIETNPRAGRPLHNGHAASPTSADGANPDAPPAGIAVAGAMQEPSAWRSATRWTLALGGLDHGAATG